MSTSTMRAFLDDKPLEIEAETLTAAVLAGKREADAKGRMIIEVWADGEKAPAEDLADPPAREPYAEEIRFVSVAPRSLVAEALAEAAENLERVREPQREAAAALARGETSDAMGLVGTSLNAWQSARKAVQEGGEVLGVTPAQLAGPGEAEERCAAAIDDLLAALREVQRSIRDQDVASLADVLEYDLDELAGVWVDLLAEMSASVRGNAESSEQRA
jgi:hypothetical protein